MRAWTSFFAPKKTTFPASSLSGPLPKTTTPQIRVVFMGTPEFSATLLSTLLHENYQIVGVVTKPDRPVGRKQIMTESTVKKLALEHHLPLIQPEKLDDEAYTTLQEWQPDLFIVAAYGKILKERFLTLPGFGAVNIHTSLLPRWRGASPIQNALLSGDKETGITLMEMDRGMDTGNIIFQKALSIDPQDTLPTLEGRLTALAEEVLLHALPLWIKKQLVSQPQDNSQATQCQLIERSDGQIIWSDDAESIYNRYRALTPWPGIYTFWKQDTGRLRLKLHQITYQETSGGKVHHPIGHVFESEGRVGIQTGRGIIFLEALQLEGRNQMTIQDFLKGNPTFIGGMVQ